VSLVQKGPELNLEKGVQGSKGFRLEIRARETDKPDIRVLGTHVSAKKCFLTEHYMVGGEVVIGGEGVPWAGKADFREIKKGRSRGGVVFGRDSKGLKASEFG